MSSPAVPRPRAAVARVLARAIAPTAALALLAGALRPAAAHAQPDTAHAALLADTAVARRAAPPEAVASAFAGLDARQFLQRVRVARLAQDSALRAYEALSRERVTATLGITRSVPIERTILRQETAARVRWSRAHGVDTELLGRRFYDATPRVPGMRNPRTGVISDGLAPVPYYPGRDALWVGAGAFVEPAIADDDDELVHPLAIGAERFYRYALGDSAAIRLPNGDAIPLRELRVTPRTPGWKVSVGSFWFDARTGQLVRAAFRMAMPIDFWQQAKKQPDPKQRPPRLLTLLVNPMRGEIDAITIEHALYEGRFWLPRAQYAEGSIQAGPSRVGIRVEQLFQYDRVNGDVPAPKAFAPERQKLFAVYDSLFARDSVRRQQRNAELKVARTAADSARARQAFSAAYDSLWTGYRALRDSAFAGECKDPNAMRERSTTRYGRRLPARVEVPCDRAKLANAAVFTAPILAEDATLWRTPQREELRDLLGLGAQAAWGPQRPTLHGPVGYTRYNRVEGLSLGGAVRQELGLGYRWEANARASVADRQLNGELFAERGDATRTLRAGAYRRLEQADDYGAAFIFGASLQNVVSGLDEQFYYRALGIELGETRQSRRLGGGALTWRVFGERQSDADARARWTLQRALGNRAAAFDTNVVDTIPGRAGTVGGVALRWRGLRGDDASPWRLTTDVRTEAAAGTFAFLRGAFDLGLERRLPGQLRARTVASLGSSAGDLPPQRWWNLGGWQTVRGMTAGTRRGDAFWMGRGELQLDRFRSVQPIVFADAGWAGARDAFRDSFRTGAMIRGAGAGVALFNGLFRFDGARGLDAGARWRFEGYAVARW